MTQVAGGNAQTNTQANTQTNLVGQYHQNINQSLNNTGTIQNQAMNAMLTDADANRQGYGDMLAQSGLLGGTSGSSGTGALPTTVNYPTLNQPIHQGNFTGSMIGSVPIYAAPGPVPPIGIDQARRHKQLKNHLGAMKGTPDYSPMQVSPGYQEKFNKKYFNEYNNWITTAQEQDPYLWRQNLTDATPYGRKFKQWRLDMEDLGRSINAATKVAQHIRKLDEGVGTYVSPKQRELADQIIGAVGDVTQDAMFKDPKGPLKLINELQVHSDISRILQNELRGVQAEVAEAIDAGSVVDEAGLGTIYNKITTQDIFAKGKMDSIVRRIQNNHPYLKDTIYNTPEALEEQVKLYFGDKLKQNIFKENIGAGGRIKAPSRVFSGVLHNIDELKTNDAQVGERSVGGKFTTKVIKGKVMTTFVDKNGNIRHVLNSDASNMSRNIVGMYPDDIDSGTTVEDAMVRVGNNPYFRSVYQDKFPEYYKESIQPLYKGLGLEANATGTKVITKTGYEDASLRQFNKPEVRTRIYDIVNSTGTEGGGIGLGEGKILTGITKDANGIQFKVVGDDGRIMTGTWLPMAYLKGAMQSTGGTLSYVSMGEYGFVEGAKMKYDATKNVYKLDAATATTAGAQTEYAASSILSPVVSGINKTQQQLEKQANNPEYQADYQGQMNMLGLKNRGKEDIFVLNENQLAQYRQVKDNQLAPDKNLRAIVGIMAQAHIANPNAPTNYGKAIQDFNAMSETEKATARLDGLDLFPVGDDTQDALLRDFIDSQYSYVAPKGTTISAISKPPSQQSIINKKNTGATGTGNTGSTGSTGSTGMTGNTGSTGMTGNTGSTGTAVSSTTFSKAFDDEKDRSYKNTATINGQPNPAYTKSWGPRVKQWDNFTGTLDDGVDQISVFEITKGSADGEGLSYDDWTKGGIAGYLPAGTDIGYTTDVNGNQVPVDSPALRTAAKEYIQDNFMQVKDLNGSVVLDISKLPPKKALRILDMHINSEDPRASLLVAAGILTVDEKKALYDGVYKTSTGKSKPNTKKVDALWVTHKAKVMNLLK